MSMPDYVTPKRFEIQGGIITEGKASKNAKAERIFHLKVSQVVTVKNPEDLGYLMRRDTRLCGMDSIRIIEL